ncbi:MAG TPA: SAM-dependent methyltransferase [Kofleriaceae bacterium]|jgi:predicted methyltransferase
MKITATLVAVLALAGCSKEKAKEAEEKAKEKAESAVDKAKIAAGSAVTTATTAADKAGSAAPAPAPYTPGADTPKAIKDAIAAPDRTPEDRALDAGRKPGEVFGFFGIAPGMKIGELFAGGGYSSEMMARIVGADGRIWAQNTKEIAEKFARQPLAARVAKFKQITPVEQPTETPFPADATNLDAVVTIINYHDFVVMNADRAKINAAVFAALKSGGSYDIEDASATAGSGTKDCATLHRIDEDVVKQEVQAAGFKLAGESDVLRNPADKRDWNSSPKAAGDKRGTEDRFVLKFTKP